MWVGGIQTKTILYLKKEKAFKKRKKVISVTS